MIFETNFKIEYWTNSEDKLSKDIILTDEIDARDILDSIRISKGNLSSLFLEAWKEGSLYLFKVIDEYGTTIDHAGYVIVKKNIISNIFPPYKNIISLKEIPKILNECIIVKDPLLMQIITC